MLSEWLVPQLQQAGIKDTVVLQLDGAPHTLSCTCMITWTRPFPGGGLEEVQKLHPLPLPGPPRSPDLTTSDNALWWFIKERVSKMQYHTTEVLYMYIVGEGLIGPSTATISDLLCFNRSVTGSCRRSLHSRDHGLSAQNIYQNMAQNSNVLRQWRSPYRCSELWSHQVRAHIKHSTITAIMSKIKEGYANFSAILYCWTDTMLRTEPKSSFNCSAPTLGMPWTGLIWLQWRSVVNKVLNLRVP
jgi:hypothetical protein